MIREVSSARVPVRIWARALPPRALDQLLAIANRPWAYGFVAAMADAHVSEGVAVGTVFATEHTLVPHALGGDLGCGMSAIRLELDLETLDLPRVVAALMEAIPCGSATHRGSGVSVPDALFETPLSTRALDHTRLALARKHLGTLGGGNHFIELDVESGAPDRAWLLVHSGSRGLGAAIAAHHAKAGEALDVREPAGAAYLRDLEWALLFAAHNRRSLAEMAVSVIAGISGTDPRASPAIDIHHNFAAREEWLGRSLLVHRKGAVAVPLGSRALVPGSMGTASYIVEGLGNEASFGSCSHGAGRVMSRTEARARVKPAALARSMRGIAYPDSRTLIRSLVEEAPCVYRDIRAVLEDQEDLVTRTTRLEPRAVVKG